MNQLIEALRFYADPASWQAEDQVNRDEMFDTPVQADNYGDRARAALEAQPAGEEGEVVERLRSRIEQSERQNFGGVGFPLDEAKAIFAMLSAAPPASDAPLGRCYECNEPLTPICPACNLGEPAPIPMILYCPSCGDQHIDAPSPGWGNPPHRSHLCAKCGSIWRPADVATEGVAAIQTKGKADHLKRAE